MKSKLLLLILAFFTLPIFAMPSILKQSRELILVSTSDWNSTQAILQRYERKSTHGAWKIEGLSIPVVVGKNGMAWGRDLENKAAGQDPIKKEGDGRTPVGVFKVGPIFGFAEKSDNKLTYFPLTNTSVCVDDGKSKYYNQLVDSSKIKKDWHSAEEMRKVPQYQHGAVIQYNTNSPVPGKGSCIFMHIWKKPTAGTAGCVATDETSLNQILGWLDPAKKPVIIFVSEKAYQNLKSEWKLPHQI